MNNSFDATKFSVIGAIGEWYSHASNSTFCLGIYVPLHATVEKLQQQPQRFTIHCYVCMYGIWHMFSHRPDEVGLLAQETVFAFLLVYSFENRPFRRIKLISLQEGSNGGEQNTRKFAHSE